MPPVGFEPTISAGERPKTYALDRAATGTGSKSQYKTQKYEGLITQISKFTVCTASLTFSNSTFCPRSVCIAHLRQECHNSKFGIFELLV